MSFFVTCFPKQSSDFQLKLLGPEMRKLDPPLVPGDVVVFATLDGTTGSKKGRECRLDADKWREFYPPVVPGDVVLFTNLEGTTRSKKEKEWILGRMLSATDKRVKIEQVLKTVMERTPGTSLWW